MAVTRLSDVIVPAEFTAYQVENSLVSTALVQSGVVAQNAAIEAQLQAGAESLRRRSGPTCHDGVAPFCECGGCHFR